MKSISTDFELFINTGNPEIAAKYMCQYPLSGVTCNPQMVAEHNNNRKDFSNIVRELRQAAGSHKLFVQTPSNDYDGIMMDAEAILKVAGTPTILKVPSTSDGIAAMQTLVSQGIDICATQVMSALQGVLALEAGVKYVSVFYCFMNMGGADANGLYGGVDAKAVYSALTRYIEVSKCPGKIMACAARTPDEISYLINTGARSLTLDPWDFDNCFGSRHFLAINKDVRQSWENVFGDVGAHDLIV